MKKVLRSLYDRQVRFWTAPTTGASAALFRIAFGLLSIWTAIGTLLNLERYFADDGLLPWSVVEHSEGTGYSFIAIAPHSHQLLLVLGLVFLASSVTLTLGVWGRISAFVAWVCVLSFQARNPQIQNGGDRLFGIMMLLAILMPLSHRWSISAWWRARRGRPPLPAASIWSVRLMQVQTAWVYCMTGFVKLEHVRWQTGKIMRDVLASPVYCEWPTYINFWPLVWVLTYSTLAFECGFPFFVWWRRTRWLWLAWGVAMHVGIELLMVIPIFSAVMMAAYLTFLTDEECERLVGWFRARWVKPPRPAETNETGAGPSVASA